MRYNRAYEKMRHSSGKGQSKQKAFVLTLLMVLAAASAFWLTNRLIFDSTEKHAGPDRGLSALKHFDRESREHPAAAGATINTEPQEPLSIAEEEQDLVPGDLLEAKEPDRNDRVQASIKAMLAKAAHSASQGRIIDAIMAMSKALKLDPENERLKRQMSNLNADQAWKEFQQSRYKKAIGFLEEALYYWPGNLKAHRAMGYTYYRMGEKKRAEEWLLSYIEKGGDRPDVYALLGRIYYQENRLQSAAHFLRMSLVIDPEQTAIQELLQKIERELEIELDFDSTETSHFLIKHQGSKIPDASRVVEIICEEAYIVLGRKLGIYPDQPVTVILYTDRQFQDVTRSPQWAEAIFDGKIRIPAKGLKQRTPVLERLVFHEYTHAVVHEVTRGRAPIWLHEGLAQRSEGLPLDVQEAARNMVSGGGPIPLSRLEGSFLGMAKPQAELAYIESRLAIEYIEQNYGPFALRELLRYLETADPIQKAVQRLTQRTYQKFYEDFRDWVISSAGM